LRAVTADGDFAETVALLHAARLGSQHSIGVILERYRGRLLDRIRLMLGPKARQLAESGDILHGAIVEIVRDLPHLRPKNGREFLGWATRIARNNIRDAVDKRREARFADLARTSIDASVFTGKEPAPDDVARDHELSDRLLEVLEELSPDHQAVIELRHFEGLPFAAIGARLQRSENAAERLHARAMVELGQRMRRSDGARS
jgi:RNA polymerase sigma-70 factor (ECF subfamily)